MKNYTNSMGRHERLINKQDLQGHTRFDLIVIIFNYDETVTLDELKGLSYDELVDYILSLEEVIVSCI